MSFALGKFCQYRAATVNTPLLALHRLYSIRPVVYIVSILFSAPQVVSQAYPSSTPSVVVNWKTATLIVIKTIDSGMVDLSTEFEFSGWSVTV